MKTSMEKQEAKPANDPYLELRVIRFLSLALIVLGLIFWLYLTVFFIGYSGPPRSLGEALLLLFPYLYLFSFFLCCLRSLRGGTILALCVIFNLPLVLYTCYALINLSPVGIMLALFPLMWILLCRERLKIERAAPP